LIQNHEYEPEARASEFPETIHFGLV
jgi:hypothetical protein